MENLSALTAEGLIACSSRHLEAKGEGGIIGPETNSMSRDQRPPKPPVSPPGDVTRLLLAWSQGDTKALEELIPLVYDELHRLAEQHLLRERAGHTLQPTAVVHEAYLRLVDQKRVTWKNRGHFFAVAAQAMRRLLVDHARARGREKRGGA